MNSTHTQGKGSHNAQYSTSNPKFPSFDKNDFAIKLHLLNNKTPPQLKLTEEICSDLFLQSD
jgi:hypothetical protein